MNWEKERAGKKLQTISITSVRVREGRDIEKWRVRRRGEEEFKNQNLKIIVVCTCT